MVEKTVSLDAGGKCGYLEFFYFVQARNATICNDAASVQKKAYHVISWKHQECNSKKRGRPSSEDDQERLQKIPHFIVNSGRGCTKLFMVCNIKEVCKMTVYHCETCSQKPGLHLGKCFKDYHTKLHYK